MSERSQLATPRHLTPVDSQSDADHSSWSTSEIAASAALSVAALGIAVAARKPMVSEGSALMPELRMLRSELGTVGPAGEIGAAKTVTDALVPVSKTPFSTLQNPFQESGRLVSGTYSLSWEELMGNFGTTAERRALLDRFKPIAGDLKAAKIESVEIGGSFASTKPIPKDIDFAWNSQQPGFSSWRLRWRNPDLVTAETDALQYRGLHNVNGAKGADYPKSLEFLRKVKIEPKVDMDIGKINSYDDMVALGKLRQQARIEAARLEEEMRQAGTLYSNGLLSLDLKTLPK